MTQAFGALLKKLMLDRHMDKYDYGIVLNHFLMQAAVDHPLTVHGTGGQTRAFIHIQDMVKCIQIALENPPRPGTTGCRSSTK